MINIEHKKNKIPVYDHFDLEYAINHGIDLQDCLVDGRIDSDRFTAKVKKERLEAIVKEYHSFSIIEDSRGWVTHVRDETKAEKRRKIRRKDRRELLEFLADFYENALNINPTFQECFDAWNNKRLNEEQIDISTHYRYQQSFARFCKEFGKYRIRETSMEMIQEFLEDIPKSYSVKSKAYSEIKSIMRGMLIYAKRQSPSMVPYSVRDLFYEMQPVKCRSNSKKEEDEVFSVEETALIVKHLGEDKNNIKAMGLLLIFLTGIRLGELVSLSGSDFLLENDVRYIHVHRTESRYSDESKERIPGKRQRKKGSQIYYLKDSPKTEAGDRKIPIPSDYQWLWIRLKAAAHMAKDHDSSGNVILQDCVFAKEGWRLHTEPFRKELYKVCDEFGIKRKSPHKIRKTYASILKDAKTDRKTVTSLMGHTEIGTTEIFYHRDRKSLDEKLKIVDSIEEFKKNA